MIKEKYADFGTLRTVDKPFISLNESRSSVGKIPLFFLFYIYYFERNFIVLKILLFFYRSFFFTYLCFTSFIFVIF